MKIKGDLIVHDITAMIHPDIVCWPGEHHLYKNNYAKSIDAGDSINVSRISCSMHLGTHVEAPYHKDNHGHKLAEFPLETFMGSAYVIDLTGVEKCITLNDVKDLDLPDSSIYLLKTRGSSFLNAPAFDPDFVYMDEKAAIYLTDKNIKAVGIDSLGIDPVDNETPHIHNIFLNANILIYEGLDLRNVKEGQYYFIGLPLRVQNAEASPVRAVLINNE